MTVNDIKRAVRAGRVRISDHAVEEAANDHLTLDDIYESIDHGEIVEGYPEDKPY